MKARWPGLSQEWEKEEKPSSASQEAAARELGKAAACTGSTGTGTDHSSSGDGLVLRFAQEGREESDFRACRSLVHKAEPRAWVESLILQKLCRSAGSFLDGGCSEQLSCAEFHSCVVQWSKPILVPPLFAWELCVP